MLKRFVALLGLPLMLWAGGSQAATNYTVKQAGTVGADCDFKELSECLAVINNPATTETTFKVTFADAAPTTYTLEGKTTIRGGVHLALEAPVVNRVGVRTTAKAGQAAVNEHFWEVGQYGGTFQAKNINFTSTGAWSVLNVGGDTTMTQCTIGPSDDNGILMWDKRIVLNQCTFDRVKNSSLGVIGGTGEANGCAWWLNGGTAAALDFNGNSKAEFMVNGGTITNYAGGTSCYGVLLKNGGRYELNNLIGRGVILAHDYAGYDPNDLARKGGTMTLNDCQFLGVSGTAAFAYIGTAAMETTMTLNRCVFEQTDNARDCCNMNISKDLVITENGQPKTIAAVSTYQPNFAITFNGCKVLCNSTLLSSGRGVFLRDGTVNLNNTLIKGFNYGTRTNKLNAAYAMETRVNISHCVIAKCVTAAVYLPDQDKTFFTIKNSVIDADNKDGIMRQNNDTNKVVKVIDTNNIKIGTYVGDNALNIPCDFINPDANDYHILPISPMLNKGLAGVLAEDADGEARPNPAGAKPDLGLDEVEDPKPGPNAARHWTLIN